jgi:hypothetical protein
MQVKNILTISEGKKQFFRTVLVMSQVTQCPAASLILCMVLIMAYKENSCCLVFGQNMRTRENGRGSISEIMERTGTLKLSMNHYDRYYGRFLEEFRDIEGVRILEIGADSGKSLMVSLFIFFASNCTCIKRIWTPSLNIVLNNFTCAGVG